MSSTPSPSIPKPPEPSPLNWSEWSDAKPVPREARDRMFAKMLEKMRANPSMTGIGMQTGDATLSVSVDECGTWELRDCQTLRTAYIDGWKEPERIRPEHPEIASLRARLSEAERERDDCRLLLKGRIDGRVSITQHGIYVSVAAPPRLERIGRVDDLGQPLLDDSARAALGRAK